MQASKQTFSRREKTVQVKVGKSLIGGGAPILLQSMTTTKPENVEETVRQVLALSAVGCGLVRITVPTLADALALEPVMKKIRETGCDTPISADIHFQPKAAFEALKWVEKVRINPGNFVDSSIVTLDNQNSESFELGRKKVREAFAPFLREAKKLGRAIRIGVNHGSLSARMLYRYGDTVEGMVESALEYLEVCEEENFDQVVVSLKASKPRIAIEAYKMLDKRLLEKNMKRYPFHVGVTEAGEGEDGRLKSAVGIGALLLDGFCDTIRVSLTEDPVEEIPVAKSLVEMLAPRSGGDWTKDCEKDWDKDCKSEWGKNSDGDPSKANFQRETIEVSLGKINIGKKNIIRVGAGSPYAEGFRQTEFVASLSSSPFIEIKTEEDAFAFLENPERFPEESIICYTGEEPLFIVRKIAKKLAEKSLPMPIALFIDPKYAEGNFRLLAAAHLGALLAEGIGNCLYVGDSENISSSLSLAYDILQAAGARRSKTEFISCPGCGRTLYDIRAVIGEIKSRLEHLEDVSIAVMGCIVNGPGEMAGADFGYVGGAPGKISLYEGLVPVKKNIPQEEALEELVKLLKARGRWREPI